MPRVQLDPVPRGGRPRKPAKSSTPVRNLLLLALLGVVLVGVVMVMPDEASQPVATVVVPGEGPAPLSDAPEFLPLRISEVMASNQSAYPDENGNYPDWVEIENYGDVTVNLEGVGLSDRDDRVLFLFPNMDLEPGGFAVVFCDDVSVSESGKPLHARFKISSLGETITLYNAGAIAIDSVTLPPLGSDISYALTPDGWIQTEMSTPAYPNTEAGYREMHSRTMLASAGLMINELQPGNRTTIPDEDGDYSDWIELYNAGGVPIDLSNYALSDDERDPVKWRFPKGAVIEPGEYYLVFASGKGRPGGAGLHPHTNFRLSSEGETVILSDILKQRIDRVTYDLLDDDVSWGRVDGDSGTWREFKQPTPGQPNNRSGQIEMDRQMRARNTTGIFISEVVSSSTGIETAYGKTSYDWIEIVNRTTQEVNLKGWGLSDNVKRPRKWRFGDITIQPGEHLLVFASGYATSPVGSDAVHATFRIGAMGETIALSKPDGTIVDKLVVPKLEVNNSYGRDFDQGGLFYYETATPAAKNDTQGFIGYAPAPTIDRVGGIFERAQTVTISAPEGVRIRYTLDGSIPTESIGYDYTGPIELTKKVVLRARGFVSGYKPSDVKTESFLINVYHILPVVSLTVDPDDLWNPVTGIYATGVDETIYEKAPPYKTATYRLVKKDRSIRERVGNIEYFTPEGRQLINQGTGVMLHGNYSLDIAQKSFRLTSKAKYGATAFNYPFFDDRPFDSYKAIILRNGGNDGSYSRLVDAMASKIVDWTDSEIIHMASTPVIVYLNGEYWGQYDIRERINEHYIVQYEGWNDPGKVDLIKGDKQVLSGSYSNYGSLIEYVRSHDLNDPKALSYVLDWIDVDNYFDFMIFEMYFANTDTGNIKFYRQRVDGAKWKWILFDLDWAYWYYRSTNGCKVWLDPKGAGDLNFENVLIRKLLAVPEMQDKFLTRYGELFQKYFSDAERICALIDEMAATIDPEMPRHFNQWAGMTPKTLAVDPPSDPNGAYNYWKSRVNRLKNGACIRPYVEWGNIQEWFQLSNEQMIGYFGPRPAEVTTDPY